jgi:hypothetical protein
VPRTRALRPKASPPTREPSLLELIEGVEAESDSQEREPEPATLDLTQLSDAELFGIAWRAGYLAHLLEPHQVEIYQQVKRDLWGIGGYSVPSGAQTLFVLECCRRFGKSFLCAVLAFELCLSKEKATVYWLAETATQVATILDSVLQPLLNVCPPDLVPDIEPTRSPP